jgi:hypothetical protein
MRKKLFGRKQFRLGLIWTIVYFIQKYGLASIAVLISRGYGIVWCCLFLTITHVISGIVQLWFYDKSQSVLHTTEWIRRIKNGEFAYESVRLRTKLLRRSLSKLDYKMMGVILYKSVQFQVKMLLWAIFNFHGRAMFIILSTQFDAFVTTVYTRDTGGLKWSPTVVFVTSFIIGLIYSTLVYSGIGKLVTFIFS